MSTGTSPPELQPPPTPPSQLPPPPPVWIAHVLIAAVFIALLFASFLTYRSARHRSGPRYQAGGSAARFCSCCCCVCPCTTCNRVTNRGGGGSGGFAASEHPGISVGTSASASVAMRGFTVSPRSFAYSKRGALAEQAGPAGFGSGSRAANAAGLQASGTGFRQHLG